MKRPRTNERLKPSGASSRFEISNWALGPIEAETRRETAVRRKRKDKRGAIVKSGVGRKERLGGRGEGGEDRNARDGTPYMCDRRLTDDDEADEQP